MKLNLGCGENWKAYSINLDLNSSVNPDIVHNLNIFPYPFKNEKFNLIEASHILEHLDKPFSVMKEIHRILKPGGRLIVKVPHFSRGFTHAEHTHGFDVTFPLYFNKNFTKSGFCGVEFKLERLTMKWSVYHKLLKNLGFFNPINSVISFLANLSPRFCSRIWCYWVGGIEEMEFMFRKE